MYKCSSATLWAVAVVFNIGEKKKYCAVSFNHATPRTCIQYSASKSSSFSPAVRFFHNLKKINQLTKSQFFWTIFEMSAFQRTLEKDRLYLNEYCVNPYLLLQKLVYISDSLRRSYQTTELPSTLVSFALKIAY